MKIKIVQQDIDLGVKRSCYSCPVAIAVIRATGDKSAVAGAGFIFTYIGGQRKFRTPKSVRDFMIMFDNDQKVEPFEAELCELA